MLLHTLQELYEHLRQQQHEHQQQEKIRRAAKELINDAYLQQEKAAKDRRKHESKEVSRLLDQAFPNTERSHDRDSSQSVPVSAHDSASQSGIFSPSSIRTEPVHGSKSRHSRRPKTALERLLTEGTATGVPQTRLSTPRSAWNTSNSSDQGQSHKDRGHTSSDQGRISLSTLPPEERQLLLEAIRTEIRAMRPTSAKR